MERRRQTHDVHGSRADAPTASVSTAEDNLWACADEKNELWCIDREGKRTVVVKDYRGKLLNGPNDVWVRPDGGLYFTDPFYPRPYWKRGPKEQDGEHVYYLAPDRNRLVRVASDLKQPNGVIGTPDGKTLYVADIAAGRTYAYDIRPDGTLAGKRLFCRMGSDGMTIDREGNVYLTGNGVTVFDRDRQANRARRRPGAVDRQRLLRRPRPAHAVHHGQQGPVRDSHARRRGRQPVAISDPLTPCPSPGAGEGDDGRSYFGFGTNDPPRHRFR